MLEIIKTTYRNGVFVPDTPIDLPDGTETEIVVEKANSDWRTETGNEQTDQSIAKFLERAGKRVIAFDAPKHFTREELHERR